jgi:hypothetical protein
VHDNKAKLPDEIQGYSHDIGCGNEVNAKTTANWDSNRGDKEDELNKYKICSGDNLLLPTGGVADV